VVVVVLLLEVLLSRLELPKQQLTRKQRQTATA
jgi:hypothetical protein